MALSILLLFINYEMWCVVSDDIVTRLRTKYEGQLPICTEAADEIERLRNCLNDIVFAVTNEGKMPQYHRAIMKKHRSEWAYLWKQIDKAIKAVRGE